jgi:hypothetical protein
MIYKLLTEDDWMNAIASESYYWDKLPDEFKTKSFALKAIDVFERDFIYFFEVLPQEFRDDKDIVLKAVIKDGTALKEASDRLKNDREVALAAHKSSWNAFAFFGEDLTKELKKHGYYGKTKTPIYLEKAVMQDQLKDELDVNLPKTKKIKL